MARGGPRYDDLRGVFDAQDDDVVRDRFERAARRSGRVEPPQFEQPRPVGSDEVVCRSCRLVVRGRLPDGVPLLYCDDCRFS